MMYRRTTILLGIFLTVAVSLVMGADAAFPAGLTAEQIARNRGLDETADLLQAAVSQ